MTYRGRLSVDHCDSEDPHVVELDPNAFDKDGYYKDLDREDWKLDEGNTNPGVLLATRESTKSRATYVIDDESGGRAFRSSGRDRKRQKRKPY